jgi:hypothetical protein
MEIEDFEEDDEGVTRFRMRRSISKKKKITESSTIKNSKKYFREDSKSKENSDIPQEEAEQDPILTEDEKNYVEMSPGKRFGRVNKKLN